MRMAQPYFAATRTATRLCWISTQARLAWLAPGWTFLTAAQRSGGLLRITSTILLSLMLRTARYVWIFCHRIPPLLRLLAASCASRTMSTLAGAMLRMVRTTLSEKFKKSPQIFAHARLLAAQHLGRARRVAM